ncbi:MAG: hypothetical protein JSR41_13910 [Proteobacteria bacterium]|nr:hypothetical protein [Pseudomonadota bacterium]
MTQNIFIEVGESPEALLGHYGKAIDLNDKNPGSRFYSVDWERPQLGVVTLKNGDGQVAFDLALGVMGSYNEDYPQEGLSRYSLYLGLSEAGTMSHDHARLKFYEMLARIQGAGWKWLIHDFEPRLNGGDALRYQRETSAGTASLDPNFELSMEDWMRLENRSPWKFYKDGVYMDIRLSRDAKRMKVDEPGAYFVSISLESYESFWRTTFKEQDRARWRELLPAARERQRATRAEAENKLQHEGYHIDTDYQNPDEEFDSDAKALPLASNQPTSSAPMPGLQPPSSLKERLGRWIKGN